MSVRESTSSENSQAAFIERRAFVRLASDLKATCHAINNGRDVGWPGRMHDISRGGIGLLLTHCFRPGSELAIELRADAGDIRRTVHARVVHATVCTIEGNTCWFLGCEFPTPLTEEEFEAL